MLFKHHLLGWAVVLVGCQGGVQAQTNASFMTEEWVEPTRIGDGGGRTVWIEEEEEEEEPVVPLAGDDLVPEVVEGESEPLEPQVLAEEHADESSGLNETLATNATVPKAPKRANCIPRSFGEHELRSQARLQLVNGSHLIQHITEGFAATNASNRTSPANCTLVFFYASWCPFSAQAAPFFNRMAQLFPDLAMMAVDSGEYHIVNAQYGILAIPTALLFHSSKYVARYNQSEFDLERLTEFVTGATFFEPELVNATVLAENYEGPIATVAERTTDYFLYLAWAIILICGLGFFGKSSVCRRMFECLRNTWREAEIQHEHQE